MTTPLRVAVIGVGNISAAYFESFPRLPGLRIVAVADLDLDRARTVAAAQGVRASTVDEILAAPDVDVVLNLTIPAAHAEIGLRALQAGKHVYGEKPLALSTDDAAPLLQLATERGLRVGSAPDTVLGTGIQTARKLIDDGTIGTVLTAHVHWSAPGHEAWHPNPFFYYQPGGGPVLDMGPYYITALITMLGPVTYVTGSTLRSPRQRVVGSGPHAGAPVEVDVDTSAAAVLQHESGAISRVFFSFDTWATRAPLFEVHGTDGTIAVPDPNLFTAPVEAWTTTTGEWQPVPANAGYPDAARGYGLADMAHAINTGRPHRASGQLAMHVLDIMTAIGRSSTDRQVIELTTTAARPAPVPEGATPDTW